MFAAARQTPILEANETFVDQHREELLDEERIPFCGFDDASTNPVVESRSRRAGARRRRPSRPRRAARARSAMRPTRSTSRAVVRRARDASGRRARAGRPRSLPRGCSISSRNVASAQWMSSKRTTSGRSFAMLSSSLRAPHISSATGNGVGRQADRRRDPRYDLRVGGVRGRASPWPPRSSPARRSRLPGARLRRAART